MGEDIAYGRAGSATCLVSKRFSSLFCLVLLLSLVFSWLVKSPHPACEVWRLWRE